MHTLYLYYDTRGIAQARSGIPKGALKMENGQTELVTSTNIISFLGGGMI